jgi:hypothetical protein
LIRVEDSAPAIGALSTAAILQRLRDALNDDAYAATFQTMGQYRTSLLKHIDNLAAASELATTNQKDQ